MVQRTAGARAQVIRNTFSSAVDAAKRELVKPLRSVADVARQLGKISRQSFQYRRLARTPRPSWPVVLA